MNKDLITIKGTKNGLVFIISPELNFSEAQEIIADKLSESKGFFKGAKYNIDAQHFTPEQITALDTTFANYDLLKNDEVKLPDLSKVTKTIQAEIAATVIAEQNALGDTLLIMRNLRSGQTIKYEGNIVIIGDVNPGAEVIAGGNIIVLGRLKGVAHAGFLDKNDAFILAYRLQPTQLRINNQVSRSPENQNNEDYPEIARGSAEGIFIEKYLRK